MKENTTGHIDTCSFDMWTVVEEHMTNRINMFTADYIKDSINFKGRFQIAKTVNTAV